MSSFISKSVDQCVSMSELTSSNLLFCPQPKDIQSSVTQEEKTRNFPCLRGWNQSGVVILTWIQYLITTQLIVAALTVTLVLKTNKTAALTVSQLVAELLRCPGHLQ